MKKSNRKSINSNDKQYIIKTSIGYFDKDSFTMLTQEKNKATKIDENRIGAYYESICSDIAMINKVDIKAECLKVEG